MHKFPQQHTYHPQEKKYDKEEEAQEPISIDVSLEEKEIKVI